MKFPSIRKPFLFLGRGLATLCTALFGRLRWQPPTWLTRSIDWCFLRPLAASLVLLLIAGLTSGGWFGWQWYQQRPKPHTVAFQVEPPALTLYAKSPAVVAPLRIRFAESVAPLALIGKPVATGVLLEPAHTGAWRWLDDRVLEFTPETDWPVNGNFTLNFGKQDFFTPGVRLAEYRTSFRTVPFVAAITEAELHQDPEDSTLKKLVATLTFSHPVDETSLKQAIQVAPGPGLVFRDKGKEGWSLTVAKDGLHAFVHSAPLAVPEEATPITLVLDKGVAAARGGNRTEQVEQRVVTVPGRYQLAFSNLAVRYVNNSRGEPEQVLMIESSFPLRDEAIANHVHAWLLPEKQHGWDLTRLREEDLTQALPLKHIPGAEPHNRQHGFALRAPIKRQIFVRVDANIEAIGGYLAKEAAIGLLHTGEYPKMLRLMGDGAVLGLAGERRVGFTAQGLPGVRIEIARLLPGQLHQLIDQNYNTFAQPSVYGQPFDRLVERTETTRVFPQVDPAKPIHDAIDLGPYLDADGGRRGVFVLRLTPFDPQEPKRNYGDYPDSAEQGDRRFLLVTDLGLIGKRDQDGKLDVFVQSISSGAPAVGAKIQILGRNGLAVAEARSDETGHASLPALEELRREKTPIMIVATQGSDLSFLPLERAEHQLDFSRFDIGGAANERGPEQITANLFTDRGLYRPGETVHLGFILRSADWSRQIKGMPVEIEITDPRGMIAWNGRRACTETGLDALDFTPGATAPTGAYTAQIYLVQNNRRASYVDSVEFVVRDFEPDRMKVDLRLAETPTAGWLRPDEVKPLLKARHLFGADASDRRVTGQMRLAPALPVFAAYPQLRFHLEEVLKEQVDEDLAETRTGPEGEATLQPNLERFARTACRLRLTARVHEAEGGRGVAAEQEALVVAAPYLVGVGSADKLDYVAKGAKRTSRWQAVDSNLQPLAVDNLTLALLEYRHLSVLVKQPSGVYSYESRRKEMVRETRPLNLGREGNEIVLPTGEPGDFAFELRDERDTVLNRIAWTVAGAANLSRSLERNAELQIKLDKASYAPGETIQISLRAPYTGAGLITIERDKVYHHAWFKTDTTSSVQTITVPEGLEGNGYVNVQFVRDPNSAEVFMSPLSTGVAPFAVSLEARRMRPVLKAPATVEPGHPLRLRLTAGTPAKAVVFAVDEGILQVAKYQTPDPLGHFFRKRMLDVQTAQILSLILPEFSRLIAAAAPGGGGEDELGSHLNPFKRKGKPPVAYWSGVVDVPAAGRDFDYRVPEYFNGRLRLVAVTVTADRIGVCEGATEVRGPWVLTPNVPAFVAPGDQFSVSVGAFSNLKKASRVSLRLATGPGLTVAEPMNRDLEIAPSREGVAIFQLQATETLGSTELTLVAESPEGKARIVETLSVRPATPYRVGLRTGMFREQAFSLPRSRDLHAEHRTLRLGLDHSPLVWAQGLGVYLEHYPYSCTEQLLSKAMPDLIAARPEQLARADFAPLQTAYSMLRQRQNESGGFGMWASNLSVEPEISVYAADFLHEAGDRGAAVPTDLERRARAFLEQVANGPAEGLAGLRTKARAVYLLCRKGVVANGPLAAIIEQLDKHHHHVWRRDLTAAYVAASQSLLKKQKEGERLIAAVPWRTLGKEEPRPEAREDFAYYDELGHEAELLTLIARHFPSLLATLPDGLLPALGERIAADQYHSLSAALLIRALDCYGRAIAPRSGSLSAEAVVAGGGAKPLTLAGRPPGADVPGDWDKVILRKEQAGAPSFFQMTEAGFDRQPPTGPLRQGIEITREYLDGDGRPVHQVRVGDEVTVRLRLRALERGLFSPVAIVDLLPGGLEPVMQVPAESEEEMIEAEEENGEQNDANNENGNETGSTRAEPQPAPDQIGWEPFFVDTRDDRVVIYGQLGQEVATHEYRVRAINAGSFVAPPPYAEGMYDRGAQGRGEAGTLTIMEP